MTTTVLVGVQMLVPSTATAQSRPAVAVPSPTPASTIGATGQSTPRGGVALASDGVKIQNFLNGQGAHTDAVATPAQDTIATSAGAPAVGSASYSVPASALWVAPWGSDSAAGTRGAPLRTLGAAVSRASSGATIALRAGTYHENVALPQNKVLTVENAPGEAVWLDGASTVTGFSASGGKWVRSNWTTTFDDSPTFTRGAADGQAPYWQFVNPAHPMAAYPDQVWVNGQALTQVATPAAVGAGTFAVDETNHQLWIGNDPTSATVTASTLNMALRVLGANDTVRGIGIRNYADSVPDMGVVPVYATGFTLENVQVLNAATTAVGVYRAGTTLRHVTVDNAGLLGIQAYLADSLTMDAVRVTRSNSQLFNATPAAGGVKVSMSRGLTLDNSVIQGTNGNAFWTDESCYDIAVVRDRILDNTGRGVFLELSEKAVVVGNVVANSGGDQILISNTARAQVWNNTVTGTTVPLHIAQDKRTPSNAKYAVDTRRPSPDPEMTWVITGTTVGNNVFQASGGISALVMVEDWTLARPASQMVSSIDGDLYSQPVAGQPKWVMAWARPGTDPSVYTTLPAFVAAQSRELHGSSRSGSSALYSDHTLVSGISGSSAVTLPSDVASRSGVAQRATLGAW